MMMENMIGEFAETSRHDRLVQAVRAARLAEAERARGPDPRGSLRRGRRAAIARALLTLAARLAPPAPEEMTDPAMAARTTQ